MRNAVKYIVGSTWQPLLVKYLSKTRGYHYKDIYLQIPASVFHPGFFFSTHLLLNQLKNLSLDNKKFLEPGAGSGFLSVYAAKQGAKVTATDINPVAVKCIKENSLRNNVRINVIESDVFDNLSPQPFDIIAINPPYYKKDAESHADYAWNCGQNGEYFFKFFTQLKNYIHPATIILMVLCDSCDANMIESIARESGFIMKTIFVKQNILETNFIYSIESI
jgi:release factor glutamine methyltransferase